MSTSQDIRLISPVNTGRESSSPPWGCGNVAFRQIQMSGVTSEIFSRVRHVIVYSDACHREVKFGALLDRLTEKDTWLATGMYVSSIGAVNLFTPTLQAIMPTNRGLLLHLSFRTSSQGIIHPRAHNLFDRRIALRIRPTTSPPFLRLVLRVQSSHWLASLNHKCVPWRIHGDCRQQRGRKAWDSVL